MLMLSVFINLRMCGWEGENGGRGGLVKGTKNGAVDSEHRPGRVKVRFFVQRATIPSKRVIFYIYEQHTCN
jgi:hypothetical protein